MIKKLTSLVIIATFSSTIIVAQSFTALYSFDSVKTTSGLIDPTAVPIATGALFGSFSATGTPANPNSTGRFSYTDWATGAIAGNNMYDSLTGSINTSEYYEVTVTPAPGFTMTLSSITFKVQRSGTGIRTYAVRSNADAYAVNLPASIAPANANLSVQTNDVFFWNYDSITSGQNGSTIILSGAAFTNTSGAKTFRFYGWNSEGSGGTFSIDDVTITGSAFTPSALAQFSANTVCFGDSTQFTDLSTSGSGTITNWVWVFGDGSAVDTTQNPSHYFSQPGAYMVTLAVTDNSSNTDTYTSSVSIYDKPEAGFTALTTICAGSILQFNDSSTIISGTIANFDWNFGDPGSGTNNVSALQSPSHTYNTAASYTATEIVTSNMGCKDTASLNITIVPYPIADFSFSVAGSTVNFTDLTVGSSSWFWDLGDLSTTNDSSVIQNPSYIYPVDMPVTACLTVTNASGCIDSVCKVIFTVGINKVPLETITTIFPNPSANGIFTVSTGNSSTKTIVTVYNIIGEIILSKEINLSTKEQTIDLSNEANGSYFVNIKSDKENSTKKITINK